MVAVGIMCGSSTLHRGFLSLSHACGVLGTRDNLTVDNLSEICITQIWIDAVEMVRLQYWIESILTELAIVSRARLYISSEEEIITI